MAQGPIQVSAAIRKATAAAAGGSGSPMLLDPSQSLLIGKGLKTSLNNAAGAAKLVDATARRIVKVIVNTAASGGTGAIYDAATAGGAAAGTLVFTIPQTAGVYDVDMPLVNGLVLAVGTAGVVALSYQ